MLKASDFFEYCSDAVVFALADDLIASNEGGKYNQIDKSWAI